MEVRLPILCEWLEVTITFTENPEAQGTFLHIQHSAFYFPISTNKEKSKRGPELRIKPVSMTQGKRACAAATGHSGWQDRCILWTFQKEKKMGSQFD